MPLPNSSRRTKPIDFLTTLEMLAPPTADARTSFFARLLQGLTGSQNSKSHSGTHSTRGIEMAAPDAKNILRQAMLNASEGGEELSNDEIIKVTEQVALMLNTLRTADFHPEFKHDLNQVLLVSYDLVATLLAPNYLIDEVISDISTLQGSLRTILSHAARSRPRISGYGLFNRNTGQILPQFYSSEAEAHAYLAGLRSLGVELPVEVTEIEAVTASVPAPRPQIMAPSDPTLNPEVMQRVDANTQSIINTLDRPHIPLGGATPSDLEDLSKQLDPSSKDGGNI